MPKRSGHHSALRDFLQSEASEGTILSGEDEGTTIAPLDLMIAAHALAIDATLVSANQALSMVEILNVEDWSL
jgi:predicted nucleic acid-binding protein